MIKRIALALLAATAFTVPAHADPLSVGIAFLVNIGYGGAISGIGATIVGSVIIGAAAIGVSLLSNAVFQPGRAPEPSPTDRQATLRQATGPRLRFYGRVKVGGTLWFFESRTGFLYSGVTLNEGEISSIEEIWLNDQEVLIDGDGAVITYPYERTVGSYIYLYFKMGTPDQAAETALTTRFSEVTADHRLRGVAYVLAMYAESAREDIPLIYPQGNPGVRLVINASLVKSVRTGAVIWSDNPADCIYDYLTGVDGASFPYGAGYLEGQIDLPSFQAFADLCDELVPLKAGGTEKRYRLWGGYGLNEPMRAVLPRMLATCDAYLYMTSLGKIGIRGGEWTAPVLTIDDKLGHIITGEFRQGQSALAAFNELTIMYMDPAQDYSETEADRWIDTANVALRGKVLASRIDLLMVPSHAQARRLGKIHTHKNNPKWIGKIITNFHGMNMLGENTVRVKFSPLSIDEDFLVTGIRILDGLTGVEATVTSLSQAAYDWDPATEEGQSAGVPPVTSEPADLPPPDNIQVAAVAAEGAVVLNVSWDDLPRPSLNAQVQYIAHGETTGWLEMLVAQDQNRAQSGPVVSGASYDIRVRTVAPGGVFGDWSTVIVAVANAAPKSLLNISVTGGMGHALLNFTTAFSPDIASVKAYRVPAGGVLNKVTHLLATYPVTFSTAYTKTDGDSSPVNQALTPDFATDTNWIKGTGWTISGGAAHGAAGTASLLRQLLALGSPGDVWRYKWTMLNRTAGSAQFFLAGGAGADGPLISANGAYLGSLTVTAGPDTQFGIRKLSAFSGDVDNVTFFKETPTSAPQGSWDYYFEPFSSAGVAGPTSAAYNAEII